MKYFLVLSSTRTGSTLLTKCLDPYCAGEIWTHPSHIKWSDKASREKPYEFMEQRVAQYIKDQEIFGAKLQTIQMEEMLPFPDGYDRLFSEVESVVFLRRKNLTEQALSDTIMRRFKKPIGKGTEEGPLSIDIEDLKCKAENWVIWYQRWSEYVQTKCNFMGMWYEELDADVVGSANKVRQFLGLPEEDAPEHGMKKLRSPEQYEEIISNYDQIIKEMGTIYGVPFGDPGTRWND